MAVFCYPLTMDKVGITKKTYNKLADLWAATSTNSFFHEKQFRTFIKKLKKGDRVADIGCASGIHVPLFLGIGRGFKYDGYDFSKSMLKIARSRYPQMSFNYLDISDKKTLPRKKYDAFWASAVLMHVPQGQWLDMFANLELLVKKGAYGYITMPEQRPNSRSTHDLRHFELMPGKKFVEHLKRRGWKIIKSGPMVGKNDIPWNWFIVRLPIK